MEERYTSRALSTGQSVTNSIVIRNGIGPLLSVIVSGADRDAYDHQIIHMGATQDQRLWDDKLIEKVYSV